MLADWIVNTVASLTQDQLVEKVVECWTYIALNDVVGAAIAPHVEALWFQLACTQRMSIESLYEASRRFADVLDDTTHYASGAPFDPTTFVFHCEV
jgi:hypothetical protein